MQGFESRADTATVELPGQTRRRVLFLLIGGLCLTLGLYALVTNVLAYQGDVASDEVQVLSDEGTTLAYEARTLTDEGVALSCQDTQTIRATLDKPVVPNDTTTIRITPSTQSVAPGDAFSVTVQIADVLDLGAFEFRLNYTQSCVQRESVQLGDFLGSSGRQAQGQLVGSGDGWLHYGAYSMGSAAGPNGDGALAIITFRASASPCQSALQLQNVIVTDTTGGTITVTSEGGQVAVEQIQPPQVTGISPTWGYAGQTAQSATVTGQDFQPGASVQLTKAGQSPIHGTFVNVQSATTISCSLNLGRAALGPWNVVVTNPDGQAGTLTNGFTVQQPPPPPTVTAITPNRACDRGVVNITNLAGSRFQQGATVKLTRGGATDIAATNVTVVSATKITCRFDPTDAPRGQWNVVVTNPDGQSGTLANGFGVRTCLYMPTTLKR